MCFICLLIFTSFKVKTTRLIIIIIMIIIMMIIIIIIIIIINQIRSQVIEIARF